MKRVALLTPLLLALSGVLVACAGTASGGASAALLEHAHQPAQVAQVTGVAVHAKRTGKKKVVKQRLRAAIKGLRVARETPKGYQREKFRLWIDTDKDCQDTRAEVLVQESTTRTTGGCTIRTGKWYSYYDQEWFTRAGDLDIDHLVPLAEAWRSGAKRWTAATRTAYANDLGDKRTLVAVSAHANRSKSDRDPADWMPEHGTCKYVTQWTAVKVRWRLSADRAEKRALARDARDCKNTVLKVRRAAVKHAKKGSGGGSKQGCKPGYSPCLPVVSDLDCGDIPASKKPVRVTGNDPYRLDGDGDGWGCE